MNDNISVQELKIKIALRESEVDLAKGKFSIKNVDRHVEDLKNRAD